MEHTTVYGGAAQEDSAAVALYGSDTMTQLAFVLDELAVNEKYNTPPSKLERAYTACLEDRVMLSERPGYYLVGSSQKAEGSYEVHDGHCTCKYATTHPGERYGCHHSVAAVMYARWQQGLTPLAVPLPQPPAARETPPMPPEAPTMDEETLRTLRHTIMKQLNAYGFKGNTRAACEDAVMQHVGLVLAPENFALIAERLQELLDAREAAPSPAHVLKDYMMTIQGKQFVQYAGLLALAHERGLQSLSATFVSVTSELALATATATFADGRTFSEAADASPENVSAGVKKHFARVALTRAKGRALRDALNITEVLAEEMD